MPADFFRLDPDDGKRYRVPVQYCDGRAVFPCPLEALGRALFVATGTDMAAETFPSAVETAKKIAALPDKAYPVTLDEPNVLVLDRPQCTAGKETIPGATVLQIDAALRQKLGAMPRESVSVQPWCRKKSRPAQSVEIVLKYIVECRHVPAEKCFLALEDPKLYRITFNGIPLPASESGFWCDRSIKKIAVAPSYFRIGKNEIILSRRYDASQPGLEAVFLLGKFGVFSDALDGEVTALRFGDWTKQGLPYYGGNLTYHLELPPGAKKLVFRKWQGTALKIKTAKSASRVLFGDVADVRRARRIHVTVLGSRRNALGPFYFDGENSPGRRGAPAQFFSTAQREKSLVPYGLIEAPETG